MENGSGKGKELGPLSEEKLKDFASFLTGFLKEGTLVLLCGRLGSGKTTFVRGMVRGIGLEEDIVRSPTFTLMNVYVGEKTIYHVDLYRLKSDDSIFFDLEEIIEDEEGIVVIEWADRFKDFWPDEALKIRINVVNETERVLVISTSREVIDVERVIESWKEKIRETGRVR